ncbi:MAG: hypothetical protein ACXAD7_03435 [Candidatus Kariarchaeaceae archaeon]|jgi:hypothetical protein
MLNIYLFGKFRQFAPDKDVSANSILHLPYVKDETLEQLLTRIGIQSDDIGELLVNFSVAYVNTVIEYDNSRVSIFPIGMSLLCGAAHLKGHNYTTDEVSVNYYGKPEIKAPVDIPASGRE